MKTGFKKVLISEIGASTIEYVMMAALIAVVAISSVEAIGEETAYKMEYVAQTMHTAGTGVPNDDIIDDEW